MTDTPVTTENQNHAQVEIEKAAYQLIKPEDITTFSKELRKFINASRLSTKIRNEEYVNVDGWKFAGLNFGLVPIVSEPIAMHKDEIMHILYHEVEKRRQGGTYREIEPFFASKNTDLADRYREKFKDKIKKEIVHDFYSYKCGCQIQSIDGKVRGSGFASCSNIELAKSSFDEFAVMSMSQTRAIGRAFKNVLGFIMKAAGYVPTPTEEMDGSYKNVVLDESSMLDVKSALEACTTVEEITRLWNELDGVTQHRTKSLFTKRKTELTKK